MLHRLDDEFVITGEVEPGTAGAGVGQLYQWFIAHRILECKGTTVSAIRPK